jgi:hypothetical protein
MKLAELKAFIEKNKLAGDNTYLLFVGAFNNADCLAIIPPVTSIIERERNKLIFYSDPPAIIYFDTQHKSSITYFELSGSDGFLICSSIGGRGRVIQDFESLPDKFLNWMI